MTASLSCSIAASPRLPGGRARRLPGSAPSGLRLDSGGLPATPWAFILRVLSGRYRWALGCMLLGEGQHAGCGILLPLNLGLWCRQVSSASNDGARSSEGAGSPLTATGSPTD